MKELLTARGYKYSQKVDRPLRAMGRVGGGRGGREGGRGKGGVGKGGLKGKELLTATV